LKNKERKTVNQSIGQDFDIENLRERLRKLSGRELIQFGKDVRYLCSPQANFGKPPWKCGRRN
jgi:hypothetical protein